MNGYFIGIGLMILGVILFFFGQSQSKRSDISASHGSVAVGRDNKAPITNTSTNINTAPNKEKHSGGHGLTILAIVVEIAGIGVTLWQAMGAAVK